MKAWSGGRGHKKDCAAGRWPVTDERTLEVSNSFGGRLDNTLWKRSATETNWNINKKENDEGKQKVIRLDCVLFEGPNQVKAS